MTVLCSLVQYCVLYLSSKVSDHSFLDPPKSKSSCSFNQAPKPSPHEWYSITIAFFLSLVADWSKPYRYSKSYFTCCGLILCFSQNSSIWGNFEPYLQYQVTTS